MTSSESDERSALINCTIGLSHLRQIEAVRRDLQAWLQAHPDDQGIRDLEARLAEQQTASMRQSAGTFAYLTTSGQEPLSVVSGPGEGSATSES